MMFMTIPMTIGWYSVQFSFFVNGGILVVVPN